MPDLETEHLGGETIHNKRGQLQFDELRERIASELVSFQIMVQLAIEGDVVD